MADDRKKNRPSAAARVPGPDSLRGQFLEWCGTILSRKSIQQRANDDYDDSASTTSIRLTKPAPNRSTSPRTASLSRTTLALDPDSSPVTFTGFAGNPSPTFHCRGPSAAGFQMPPMIGEPSGEKKRRKVEG